MWHRSPAGALALPLRILGKAVDPDLVIDKARKAGVRLPIEASPVANLDGQLGHRVKVDDYAALGAAVDKLIASNT